MRNTFERPGDRLGRRVRFAVGVVIAIGWTAAVWALAELWWSVWVLPIYHFLVIAGRDRTHWSFQPDIELVWPAVLLGLLLGLVVLVVFALLDRLTDSSPWTPALLVAGGSLLAWLGLMYQVYVAVFESLGGPIYSHPLSVLAFEGTLVSIALLPSVAVAFALGATHGRRSAATNEGSS